MVSPEIVLGVFCCPGLVDQAFVLDGEDDFVEVPYDLALNLGDGEQVLIEKWIQRFSANSEG